MEFLRQAVRASDLRLGRVESSMARKEELLDAYFVDDGWYMIAHKQAAELIRRMRVLRLDLLEISAVQ